MTDRPDPKRTPIYRLTEFLGELAFLIAASWALASFVIWEPIEITWAYLRVVIAIAVLIQIRKWVRG